MEFIETELDPSRLAIAATDRDLSWAELKKLSDQLCEKLSSTGIPQGCPVIIYGQKEHLFQAAVLSCMRLKLPYIPIDRVMPPERIKRIVEISGAQLLICSGEEIPRDRFPFIITNKLEVVSSGKCNWQRLPVDSTDPVAYVMFTSGSTGEPKGVMITHSAAKSFANWFVSNASITPDTVFMNQAIFSFDLSLLD
ncbi:MAG TPA: AMP-binding protein, partial [Bacteroidia bacterium]|nr:AMP-binding protein [Bacteroidia bacterium]